MARTVVVTAPAKVNLFLGVGGIREDGYHEVVTVMHALELGDRITVTASKTLAVTTTPDLGVAEEQNLAWQAAIRFAETTGVGAAVDILIEKRIPHGAGLGGGSSDAAAVIAALCALHEIRRDERSVLAAAAAIGADVPFFLAGPAALMGGRGDVLVRALPPIRCPVALIKPADAVSTAEAYREFDRAPVPCGDPARIVAGLERGEFDAEGVFNNLEAAAIALVPESGDALALASSSVGVRAASISGSGSSVFAVCSDLDAALSLAAQARERGWWSSATWTTSVGMTVADNRLGG
jgi:4-diphosphocytidyl-2-C-methyl-D-erythritol kinase